MSLKISLRILVSAMLASPVWAAGEADLLGDLGGVRSEQSMHTVGNAMWTLPFETTQYIPANPTATMKAALDAQNEGRFIETIALLEQPGHESELKDTELLRARFYLQGGQYEKSREILDGVLSKHPDDIDALSSLANVLLWQGDIKAAELAMQKARGQDSNARATRIDTYILQAQGRLAEASALMVKQNETGSPDALNLAREAELALSLGDHARAAQRIQRAREQAPDSPYVMAISGLNWLIEDKPTDAQRAFEAALKRDPQDPKALLGLGLAEARQGKLDQSIGHLKKAANSDPSSAVIQTYLGRALQQADRDKEARKAFESAIKFDPNDPQPWIFLAQLQNETGQPAAALQSLKQAQKLKSARGVYRGENLLKEDEQTIQANLATSYNALGLKEQAWRTLVEGSGEKNAQNLKNQAEALQGQRFAENARRSLALQSLFNDDLDALPVTLDIYGDRAGQSGASTPQHGPIGGLSGQHASYGDYGALFSRGAHIEADGVVASNQSWGEQIRASAGNDQFGVSIAQRHYETDGFSGLDNLDNTAWQGVLKWHPTDITKLFFSYNRFESDRGEIYYPNFFDDIHQIENKSWVARFGLGQRFGQGELRILMSRQETDQQSMDVFSNVYASNSDIDTGEVQYLQPNRFGVFQAGLQLNRGTHELPAFGVKYKYDGYQAYLAQKFQLGESGVLDVGLGHAKYENDELTGFNDISMERWTGQFGLTLIVGTASQVRLAAGQYMGAQAVGNAGLMPIETAGFINIRPSDQNKLVKIVGLALDHKINLDWMATGEIQARNSYLPTFWGDNVVYKQKEGKLALAWQPSGRPFTAGLSAGYEMRDVTWWSLELDSIENQRLRDVQLSTNWFIRPNLTLRTEISRNWVDGDLSFVFGSIADVSTQVNASLRWKLRNGHVELGVRNLLGDEFDYSESDPLIPRFTKDRFIYGSTRLNW